MRAAIEQDVRTCLTADGRNMPTPECHVIITGEGANLEPICRDCHS
jgi:hypothetical protein